MNDIDPNDSGAPKPIAYEAMEPPKRRPERDQWLAVLGCLTGMFLIVLSSCPASAGLMMGHVGGVSIAAVVAVYLAIGVLVWTTYRRSRHFAIGLILAGVIGLLLYGWCFAANA